MGNGDRKLSSIQQAGGSPRNEIIGGNRQNSVHMLLAPYAGNGILFLRGP